MSKSAVVVSHGKYMFSFVKKKKKSAMNISRMPIPFYIPTGKYLSDSVSLHSCRQLMLALFFILAILLGW